MAHIYQHVYQALRNSLVDRDRDEDLVLAQSVVVQTPDGAYGMKKELPSTAYLISYSMLFLSPWLKESPLFQPKFISINEFAGGEENSDFPFLFNEHIVNLAVAVGVYSGLFNATKHPVSNETVLIPNYQNPLVRRTRELILEHDLTYKESKEILVELLQQDEFNYGVILADDFIANAKFIEEAFVAPNKKTIVEGDQING